jgi:hypothetical protein
MLKYNLIYSMIFGDGKLSNMGAYSLEGGKTMSLSLYIYSLQ